MLIKRRKLALFLPRFILCLTPLFFCVPCYAAEQETSEWTTEPQIEVGTPNIVIDGLGNILSLPKKIILLDLKIDNHAVSPQTTQAIRDYIQDNPQWMKETKVRVNQFTPVGEFKRLVKNKKIRWWWRVFPGVPVTIFSLGGRLFGGDHYNPYTDTIHLYSDIAPIALHEAGHAVDTAKKVKEGWADYYTLGRIFPAMTLHQEFEASHEAIHYLEKKGDQKEENNAYRILYPAYGTYAGSSTGIPYGDVAGAMVGHVVSIVPRHNAKLRHKAIDGAVWGNEISRDLELDPLIKNLIDDVEQREYQLNQALLADLNVFNH